MISDNVTEWMGLPVKVYDFKNGATDYVSNLYRFAIDWDADFTVVEALEKFLAHPDAGKVPGIVIGLYAPEMEGDSAPIVKLLAEARDKLTSLRGIFMNDIISEEQEISWIENSSMAPLLAAYPKLEHFRVRGGQGLVMGSLQSEFLRSLVVETGGLDRAVVQSVAASNLPNLEHLELWLGTDDYGGTTTIDDVRHLLADWKFPRLKYLGLRDCEFADELAQLVASSPMMAHLDVLDLSLGTMGDAGAKALLASEHLGGLKKLDLHHHYMSPAAARKLAGLKIAVDVSDPQTEDIWDGKAHRYVAVAE